MAKLRVILDKDEVLCDFVGAALHVWGLCIEQVLPHWQPGEWSCVPPLGKALGRGLTDAEFWEPITALGAEFWRGLEPHPWMDELLALAHGTTDDWHVVTAPSRCPTSYMGKAQWAQLHLRDAWDRLCPYRHKEVFAGPNVVLIDDRDENVRKFRAAGGRAVVFPRHWNSMHRVKNDPLRYVRQALTYHAGDVDDISRGRATTTNERRMV